ncbi:aminotransferase class V-fold PLP-dependent enzyme [Rhodospirillaceae bacterium]|jgi:alanine-glyoxylate transaminase/serine-glyoxylate transaminase/serine-pyruvate transaminase|nr:serine--glyoxylate aminotransferase [Rhodospirillaceae bacterium]MDG1273377.1 aminotransferase class V-fold PLP-dependent enzyme [Alphaproteobacteria bacterium]MBT5913719.1 aminotransferase class V-fold PLP-dependent enzyme [Rhodospirillaceae bacterium]MBT6304898.1 aminotransferase class V-fold PLP-dependent enzyme [Rhodospirillaceae bacterium]MDC1442314.1 aminotransferase class V-fold PLP-dependent enzyme [Rhodospirillaceae bacterium]|tara:strand:+ start:210 stop:1379 length:1170 start_codon:yes stop_codon:yes gene_type:complete
MSHKAGPHFLQIPGPSNVPGRILRAIERPTIDHRGPTFQVLACEVLEKIKPIFKTVEPVVIFPSSGTGAWEAALVNTLSPGDKVLMYETGQFANLWVELATRIGLETEVISGDWRFGVDSNVIEERLRNDAGHKIKAVCIVHNETSTGVTSKIKPVRDAIDKAKHPALFMVDTISGLCSADYRHDEWGVDVTISGSQKGLMLPPGLGFNAVSKKAVEASKSSKLIRSYWDWGSQLANNPSGNFPYTPATNLLYGLVEACDMLMDEGLDNVFSRHERHAEAARRAVKAWGLEIQCAEPTEYSPVLTGVIMPEGHDADALRAIILDKFNMSLGSGLGKIKGKVFRIGHLGDFNDLMLMGTLSGVEMGLTVAGVPHKSGGVQAAMEFLTGNA